MSSAFGNYYPMGRGLRLSVDVLSNGTWFETVCGWSSSFIHIMEASIIYRNHILAQQPFRLGNEKHRDYPRKLFQLFFKKKLCEDSKIHFLADMSFKTFKEDAVAQIRLDLLRLDLLRNAV